MIADLHCHYPMHLPSAAGAPPPAPGNPPFEEMARARPRPAWVDKLRAWLLARAAERLNYRTESDTWRVSFDRLVEGELGLVFSVLYQPFAEMDLGKWPSGPPESGYFDAVFDQLRAVEADLRELDPQRRRHVVIRAPENLRAVRADGRAGFVHCIEGGFHLGADAAEIRQNVSRLAEAGVAYVTLAHLFFRGLAKNAPALPFLPDFVYRLLFWQRGRDALTELGRAAVESMYEHRVLIDISHMSERAIEETFAEVERLDELHGAPPSSFPVIATHAAIRLSKRGSPAYSLAPATIERIAARGGVIGLIFAQHQLKDGRRRPDTTTLEESLDLLGEHIDAIHEVVGSYENVAIGSDLDGFIKPTLGGIEKIDDLRLLREPLERRYPGQADAILFENAARVLAATLEARERARLDR